jgi:hypothetical protein
MRRLFGIGVATGLLVAMASICFAATNLNSSRSNIYRLVYDPTLVTSSQATAILAELDKIGPKGNVDEATLRKILLKRGVPVGSIKKIVMRKSVSIEIMNIILLTDLADEAQALAVSDEGTPADKKKSTTK